MGKKMILAAAAVVLMVGYCAAARPPMKLGCQLWGVKDLWFDKSDKLAAFAEIFPKIRAMGYDGVQCGSFIRMDADGLEKILKENGLSVVDQPIAFDDVEDEAKLQKTVAFCRRFKVDFLYIPWFEGKTAAEWRAFCGRLDAAEAKLRPYGIRVGYHHHIHELTTKVDGEFPWDILTGPNGARLEMDIGPVLEGGRVPAEEIAKMCGRLPGGIHAKPLGATAAGAAGDRQDWPKVVAAAEKAGVKWLVVECEKRQDTLDDIAESARNLRPLVSLVNALR
ncbi:MAG: sugar phosphate isomerase/epimerase [Kiritimatiellae bacterium]|nr:sugar phosphate isomerase/epimerase [Kiritimatiellia bacterium]